MPGNVTAFQRLPLRLLSDSGTIRLNSEFADPDESGEQGGV